MEISIASIVTLVFNSLIYSFFYFYIYKKSNHKYLSLWGFSWIIYSLGYLFYLIFSFRSYALLFSYFFSIVSSFVLLLGTLQFINSRYFKFILNVSIFISSIVLLGYIYILTFPYAFNFTYLFSFSASLVLSLVSVGSGIVFLVFEDESQSHSVLLGNDIIKHITGWTFIIWGIHKGYYPFVSPDFYSSTWNYLSSIILINIVNISLILTYSEQSMIDIKKKEQQYRLLAENSKDIIAQIHLMPNFHFSYISPATELITGYTSNEFLACSQLFIDILHPEDKNIYIDFLHSISDENSLVFRIINKDQKIVWLEQQTAIITCENSNLISFEVTMRDITIRKVIEDNLFKIESSRRHLLANISHELKTPITSIIGYLSVLVDNIVPSSEEYNKYLKLCLDKSLTLKVLIQDLFELSKLESIQMRLHYESYPVREFTKYIYNKMYTDITSVGISFDLIYHCGKDKKYCPCINIDVLRIEQVFRNIIGNSINNIVSNGHIYLHCNCGKKSDDHHHSEEDHMTFTIEDNGIGISDKDLPYIFERFYKKKSLVVKEGTGLGLSISKEIVSLHRGRIWAKSMESKGTKVYISLPLHKV